PRRTPTGWSCPRGPRGGTGTKVGIQQWFHRSLNTRTWPRFTQVSGPCCALPYRWADSAERVTASRGAAVTTASSPVKRDSWPVALEWLRCTKLRGAKTREGKPSMRGDAKPRDSKSQPGCRFRAPTGAICSAAPASRYGGAMHRGQEAWPRRSHQRRPTLGRLVGIAAAVVVTVAAMGAWLPAAALATSTARVTAGAPPAGGPQPSAAAPSPPPTATTSPVVTSTCSSNGAGFL